MNQKHLQIDYHCKGCGRFVTFPDDHTTRGDDYYTCNKNKLVLGQTWSEIQNG